MLLKQRHALGHTLGYSHSWPELSADTCGDGLARFDLQDRSGRTAALALSPSASSIADCRWALNLFDSISPVRERQLLQRRKASPAAGALRCLAATPHAAHTLPPRPSTSAEGERRGPQPVERAPPPYALHEAGGKDTAPRPATAAAASFARDQAAPRPCTAAEHAVRELNGGRGCGGSLAAEVREEAGRPFTATCSSGRDRRDAHTPDVRAARAETRPCTVAAASSRGRLPAKAAAASTAKPATLKVLEYKLCLERQRNSRTRRKLAAHRAVRPPWGYQGADGADNKPLFTSYPGVRASREHAWSGMTLSSMSDLHGMAPSALQSQASIETPFAHINELYHHQHRSMKPQQQLQGRKKPAWR